MLKSPLGGAFLGFWAGMLVVVVLIATDVMPVGHSSSALSPIFKSNKHGRFSQKNADTAFVEAWTGKLHGSYIAHSTFTRTRGDSQPVSFSSVLGQNTTAQVQISNGQVTKTFTNNTTVCAIGKGDVRSTCRGPFSSDRDANDQRDIDSVRVLVTGVDAPYRVSIRNDGCFELNAHQISGRKVFDLSTLQWGSYATLCFDSTTGALASSRVNKGSITDVMRATSITPNPTDEQLRELGDSAGALG